MSDVLDINQIKERLKSFADERDWNQFHNPKNLAMALSVEASELVEIFQWLKEDESSNLDESKLEHVSQELADIILYAIRMAGKLNINISKSIDNKIKLNNEKYPKELAKGNSKKYSELNSGE